jgi:hypothetical protein
MGTGAVGADIAPMRREDEERKWGIERSHDECQGAREKG